MGTLHRLPTRKTDRVEPDNEALTPDKCEGVLHVFEDVPGECQCGTVTWETDGTLDDDAIGIHHVT